MASRSPTCFENNCFVRILLVMQSQSDGAYVFLPYHTTTDIMRSILGPLGEIRVLFVIHLGRSWGHLGSSWGSLGSFLGSSWAVLGIQFRASWQPAWFETLSNLLLWIVSLFGSLLGVSWAHFGTCRKLLGISWKLLADIFGSSWNPILRYLGTYGGAGVKAEIQVPRHRYLRLGT